MKRRHAIFTGLVLALALICVTLAPIAQAHDEWWPQRRWQPLPGIYRLTYYGPYFTEGMTTASGESYAPDADLCAVGPKLLAQLRSLRTALNTFTILPCWTCVSDTWGYVLWLTGPDGRGVKCRVLDTGLDGLGVDLPDAVFHRLWGADRGMVYVTIDLMVEEEMP